MIVTSNKPFSAWGEIFGDDMAATAMIDRLIHHSEILSLKGDSYRLRGKDLDARIGAKPAKSADRSPSPPSPRGLERRTTRRSTRFELKATRSGGPRRTPAASRLRSPTARCARSRPSTPKRDHFSTGTTLKWPSFQPAPSAEGGTLFNRRGWGTFRPAVTRPSEN
jgi:IstB-like ATP binding protein